MHKVKLKLMANNERWVGIMTTIRWIMVSVLKWGDIIAEYALFEMINYLTITWGLGFAHAAGVINIFFGTSKILQICFAFMKDTRLGIFKTLLLSSVAYSIGLAFLSMSTPPVLSNLAGNCNRYEAECLGPTQKAIFFTSLVLIAVGMAGHSVSLDIFIDHQTGDDDDSNDVVNQEDQPDDEKTAGGFWTKNNLMSMGISAIAALALSNIKPWDIKFGIPAIVTFTATLVFFAGKALGFYSNSGDKPKGSGLTTVLRVFVAALYKCRQPLPQNPTELFETNGDHRLPHTNRCRCLDKAAIVLAKESEKEEKEKRWKVCTVTEVEETKISLMTCILWTPCITCGLVSSIGNTFFVAQAYIMNPGIGKWNVPLTILLLLSNAAKKTLVFLWSFAYPDYKKQHFGENNNNENNKDDIPKILLVIIRPMGTGMLYSVLCCLTAALVENKRRNHHRTKISIFWLIPQFYFLTIVDWFFEQSLKDFFEYSGAPSRKKYAVQLMHFVGGIGQVLSVVSALACKKWFNNDIDKSRLDKYYWTLTALSAVVFSIWFVVAYSYKVRAESRSQSANSQLTHDPTPC